MEMQIVRMTPDHVPGAMVLKELAGWNQLPQDWSTKWFRPQNNALSYRHLGLIPKNYPVSLSMIEKQRRVPAGLKVRDWLGFRCLRVSQRAQTADQRLRSHRKRKLQVSMMSDLLISHTKIGVRKSKSP